MNHQRQDPTAEAIRAARAAKKWTQTDLAGRAGCSRWTVSKVESGKRVRAQEIEAILQALGFGPGNESPSPSSIDPVGRYATIESSTADPNRIFISHSTEDASFVEREILPSLRKHGLRTWYSKEDIKSPDLWEKSIRVGLQSSGWFLLVMSAESVKSKWVARELHWAMERRADRIVPVCIDEHDCGGWHLGLQQIEYIDFTNDPAQARRRLLAVWDSTTRVTMPPAASGEESSKGPRKRGRGKAARGKQRAGAKTKTSGRAKKQASGRAKDKASERAKDETSERAKDKANETWVSSPARLGSSAIQDACVVQIYPTESGMGRRYSLTEEPAVLGRGADCDIRINDLSVSRRHARIQTGIDGYYAVDLHSTNGTFVNDAPASICKLRNGDNLRLGKYLYRFLAGGNVEAAYYEEIHRLAIIDALTDIHNKRYLEEFLDRELSRSTRYGRPLSLILFGIDDFKSVNEELGILGGELTLRELSACVKGTIHKEELFARYGGDEFAIVLPDTALEGGRAAAEQLRQLVECHRFKYEGVSYPVTVSVGVAATGGQPLTTHDLIRRADEKLYLAKNSGCNRVMA